MSTQFYSNNNENEKYVSSTINNNFHHEDHHSYDPKILEEIMQSMNNKVATADDNNEKIPSTASSHMMESNKNINMDMDMNDDINMNMDDDTSGDNIFCTPGMMMMMSMPGGSKKHSSTGTIMYMDGFHMTMSGGHQCLNLYFPTWTLDTRPKFLGACTSILLLSFLTEGLSKLRYKITASSKKSSTRSSSSRRRRRNQQQQQQQNNNDRSDNSVIISDNTTEEVAATTSTYSYWINRCSNFLFGLNKRLVHLMISVLHGVQALLGYILMLAGMTFSIELLLSVIIGLGIGYAVFFSNDTDFENHVTTNPCCNYMQDEANEIPTQKNNGGSISDDDNTSMGSEEDDLQQHRSSLLATGAMEDSSNVV